MFTLISRKVSRAAIVAALTLAGGALFAASGDPAMALCKRGGPHCVPDNSPPAPIKVPGGQIPPDSWNGADDCQFFPGSMCGTAARRTNPSPVIKNPAQNIKVH